MGTSDAGAQAKLAVLGRALLAIVGLAMLAAGAVAVFREDNEAGSAALITVGAVLALFASFANRIDAFEFGGAKVTLRRAAAVRLALANQSERRGDRDAAERLRDEARVLLEAAEPFVAEFGRVREAMPPSRKRTVQLERILDGVRREAADTELDASEVADLFHRGGDTERIVALALMQGDVRLADFDVALDAIRRLRNSNEQYQALRLAREMLPELKADQRQALVRVLEENQRLKRYRPESDRGQLSSAILAAARPPDGQ